MFAHTTLSGSGRGFALAASAFATFVLFPAFTVAAEESKSVTIGPWKIEAVFKGDMFDRCSINRTLKDDIVATFVRTGEALKSRTPISELEARRRQALSVKMTLGPPTIDRRQAVAAQASLMWRAPEPRSACRSTKARSRSTGLKNASRRTIARSRPTLLSHRHVSPNGWSVGGRNLQ